MTTMQKIVARASNRVFVGLPLCASFCHHGNDHLLESLTRTSAGRNEEFLALPLRFTLDVMKDTVVMSITPPFLKR